MYKSLIYIVFNTFMLQTPPINLVYYVFRHFLFEDYYILFKSILYFSDSLYS